jgi:hypothetical protein
MNNEYYDWKCGIMYTQHTNPQTPTILGTRVRGSEREKNEGLGLGHRNEQQLEFSSQTEFPFTHYTHNTQLKPKSQNKE